ncbi:MAG: hypothetical protein HC876_08785 [Chloroflexaceae bacterium]|nr:hypothetical protein [Chloroflexaceae bacterium]NJO05599.1 hypothetical protein [Chloroflexaceae bacterium]
MVYRILIVGEDAATRNRYAQTLIGASGTSASPYQVVTVSSAAAAQLQVTRQQIYLMIVRLALYNDVLLDLVRRVKEIYPDMAVLIIHDQHTYAPQLDVLKKFGVHTMLAPVEDAHLQAMVVRLLGLAQPPVLRRSVAAPTPAPASEPVNSNVHMIMDDLRRQARAQLALYTDNLGNIINQCGDDSNIEVTALSSLIASSFINSVELGRLLHDPNTIHLSIHEGRNFDVYSANVGDDRLLALFFDKQFADPKLGFIWLMMKRVAQQLHAIDTHQRDSGEGLGEHFRATFSSELERLFGSE